MHHRNSMPRVCSPRLQCTPPVLLNPPWTAARPRRGARIPRKCDLRGKQQGPAGFEIFNRPSGSAALFMFGPGPFAGAAAPRRAARLFPGITGTASENGRVLPPSLPLAEAAARGRFRTRRRSAALLAGPARPAFEKTAGPASQQRASEERARLQAARGGRRRPRRRPPRRRRRRRARTRNSLATLEFILDCGFM